MRKDVDNLITSYPKIRSVDACSREQKRQKQPKRADFVSKKLVICFTEQNQIISKQWIA